MSHILYQKLLKSQSGKKKQKSTSSELTDGHISKKSKKQKELIDENEEILSESDIEEEDEQNQQKINGNVRLDNLLFNEEDDDETNVHEQRLKRAKEYIEQIAKQGQNSLLF